MKIITLFVAVIIINHVSLINLGSGPNLKNESLKASKDFRLAGDVNLGVNSVNKVLSADLFSNSYMMLMSVFALSSIILIVALLPILTNSSLSCSG